MSTCGEVTAVVLSPRPSDLASQRATWPARLDESSAVTTSIRCRLALDPSALPSRRRDAL